MAKRQNNHAMLLAYNVGKVDISYFIDLFVANDGFWSIQAQNALCCFLADLQKEIQRTAGPKLSEST
jgi:hypothetical protein